MRNNKEMEAFVVGLLNSKLPSYCYYHNVAHTLYVMDKTVEIGLQEKCTPAEIDLLQVAALWHDTGHINRYTGHEEASCLLAQQYMPQYGYDAATISKICGMIMTTKTPQTPHNQLEEIIADADLEYLGTDSVEAKSTTLFNEMKHLDPYMSKTDWTRTQIAFLEKHHYFTRYCIEFKEPEKAAYLAKLRLRLDRQLAGNDQSDE